MAKGIIYVMSTVVDGLIKIGKTTDFESRMFNLENNGYRNVTGLKREFAIELENFNEKEALLDDLFAKSRVGTTELFSLDVNKVIQLLSSFEGKIIYPIEEDKEEVFENATEAVQSGMIPDGKYTLVSKIKSINQTISATMEVIEGKMYLKKGADIAPLTATSIQLNDNKKTWVTSRNLMKIKNDKLLEDVEFTSPSYAAAVVVGHSQNGWEIWKDKNGNKIDIYRRFKLEE